MDSDTDSETSSNPSLSPTGSPTLSFHPTSPPTLERLVLHYTSAKHSLASTHYIYRANELVTSSRALIEEIAILNARNEYLRHGVDEQVEVLGEVKEGLEREGDAAAEEFRGVVEGLDRANARLEGTVRELKGTAWAGLLRQKAKAKSQLIDERESPERSDGDIEAISDTQKTLYDFIDPLAHESLLNSLRADIDAFHGSHDDFSHSLETFTSSISTIKSTLSEHSSIDASDKPTLYDSDPPSTIRGLFGGIEEHAAALAELLQGLVRHYDLCVNALKHTEGGGEAAKQAVQLESDPKADNEPVEESLYLRKAPLPISDDERTEMLAVLERDASELDEVVTEIRDRNTEQETLFSHLAHMAKGSRKHDTILREALVMLQEMRSLHLPSHLHALSTFQADWIRLRASMQSKTDSLLELATSNEGFIHAYVELLKEVQRRDAVRERIQEIEVKARKEIARLEEGDERARREFVETFGGSLPRGIWDGEDLGR